MLTGLSVRRVAVVVEGTVQGIGFRPFVFREALACGLTGWVRNQTDGVHLEIQGDDAAVDRFLTILQTQPPPEARITRVSTCSIPLAAETDFKIESSAGRMGSLLPSLPADLAVCDACTAEIRDPRERRYRYPFTNCTRCGPRYSIVESLPYDRPRTSMRDFELCPACQAEYADPADRRFHAQPVACPKCGPALSYLDPAGRPLAADDAALTAAVAAILDGRIVALKGVGGFQLLCDATNGQAVATLRERKRREAKPLAVMFPSLDALRAQASVSPEEERLLTSVEAPVVLVRRRDGGAPPLAAEVAPANPWLGALLPYSPLHALLMAAVERPVVCTSGNLSDEPMCIENDEAVQKLGRIADGLLVHDRRIVRPVDDSVARMGPAGPQVLRRARGHVPRPLPLAEAVDGILALGGHLKATVALGLGCQAVMSQHLGDLDSLAGATLLEATVEDLLRFFGVRPRVVACDLHPEYASTRLAERLAARYGVPLERIQHHHAHVAAAKAEHGLGGAVLGFAWDGSGYGCDGALWGGEALLCEGSAARRVAHLRAFPLPGGEAAARDPRRAALGLLFAQDPALARQHAPRWFRRDEADVLLAMLADGRYAPMTTSIGRLFDAVAALLGVGLQNRFEGEAAMALEFAAGDVRAKSAYPLPFVEGPGGGCWDWGLLVEAVLQDFSTGISPAHISAAFHGALAAAAQSVVRAAGVARVILAGGCFQNLRLVTEVREGLEAHGYQVYVPGGVPPGDGGLALGQLLVASRRRRQIAEDTHA